MFEFWLFHAQYWNMQGIQTFYMHVGHPSPCQCLAIQCRGLLGSFPLPSMTHIHIRLNYLICVILADLSLVSHILSVQHWSDRSLTNYQEPSHYMTVSTATHVESPPDEL